jgi:hypothetical protein
VKWYVEQCGATGKAHRLGVAAANR